MSIISPQPFRVPLVDPQTGLITPPWVRYFLQLLERVGGPDGQTNQELVADMHDDAGLEELKHEYSKAIDGLALYPRQEPAIPYQDLTPAVVHIHQAQDPHARIEYLEAQVAELARAIEGLQQGT